MIRVYGFGTRSRPAAIALAALALALGAIFVAFGMLLLLGLAAVGTLVGGGVLLFRSLTGRRAARVRQPRGDADLDPTLEVFGVESTVEQTPHKLTRAQGDRLAP